MIQKTITKKLIQALDSGEWRINEGSKEMQQFLMQFTIEETDKESRKLIEQVKEEQKHKSYGYLGGVDEISNKYENLRKSAV